MLWHVTCYSLCAVTKQANNIINFRDDPEASSHSTALVDSLPGIVYRRSIKEPFPVVYLSRASDRLLGYLPETLTSNEGFTFHELIDAADRNAVLTHIAQAIETRSSYLVEYRVTTRNNEHKWFWEQGIPVTDTGGKVIELEGFISDITAHKAAESELRHAKRKYQSIFVNAVEGIFQSSVQGKFIEVNPALARMYGFESPGEMLEELTDIRSQLYVEPRRRDEFLDILSRRDYVKGFESQIYRKDGKVMWISENARAVRDDLGGLLYFEGTVEEITRRKAAEELLARERNMLRTLIDHWPESIYVKGRHGEYLLSNPVHARNLQMNAPGEVEGRSPKDFFLTERATRLMLEDEKVMETGEMILAREECHNGIDGKPYWSTTTKIPLRGPDGDVIGLVCISRDTTQSKHLEAQLRQSQKMEAIGQLAGGIAHDFNNILTAILGYSELIVARAEDNSPLLRDAQEIHAGALRAAALTQQLLAFSRKQPVQAKVVNLNSTLQSLQRLLTRLIGENIALTTKLDPDLACIKVDPGQMEQVIVNMAVNSRDAMPRGGNLVMNTANVFLDKTFTSRRMDVEAGHYVRLSITDNGTGMSPEVQQRIFEPFFTTKENGKGTGLGLAMSYGIVKQSAGHIDVYSEKGRGTTFNVYLPIADSLEAGPEQFVAAMPSPELAGGTERVLLVEDDDAVRKLMAENLESLGYTVIQAVDGKDALRLFHSGQARDIDLLLTDIVMPHIGGRQLANSLEIFSPRTKVLFTSGYNEEAIAQEDDSKSHIHFLQKPYLPSTLAKKMRSVLES